MRFVHPKALLVLAVLSVALAGCGGKYRGNTSGGNNNLAGAYTGNFVAAGGQDSGNLNFDVANSGTITGSIVVPSLGSDGESVVDVTAQFTGTVSSTGAFEGHSTSITASGPATLPTSITFSGTITRTTTGATGSITRIADGGTPETESFVATLNQN